MDPVDPAAITAALNGEWYCLRFVANGENLPDDATDGLKMVFANGKYVMTLGPNIETGSYTFDSTTDPFGLTINIETGKNKGQSRHGSFRLLTENRLILVMATDETGSPNRFVSTAKNKNIMGVYRKSR